jgi:hypothetical protein
MPTSDPALREKIESTKVIFNQHQEDVISADRVLFHRTLALTEEGIKHFQQLKKTVLNRFSIRYVPGTARSPTGYKLDLSLLLNIETGVRTLNEAVTTTSGSEKDAATTTAGAPQHPARKRMLPQQLLVARLRHCGSLEFGRLWKIPWTSSCWITMGQTKIAKARILLTGGRLSRRLGLDVPQQ